MVSYCNVDVKFAQHSSPVPIPPRGVRKSSVALVGGWLALVLTGMFFLTRYEWQPGMETGAPVHWPAASHITAATGEPTLLLFLHPHCACSAASIAELGHLMTQTSPHAKVVVVFVHPPGAPADWSETDLWKSAAKLPGVQLLDDRDGHEADDFTTGTSGRTLLYGADGNLLFAGGITPGRGEEGNNPGIATLTTLLKYGSSAPTPSSGAPVFGCPLQTPSGTPAPATPEPVHRS